jgi:hypothetical protein
MELAVIRWVCGEIRILSYFKNLVLLAAFLGLAIGFAIVGKGKDYKTMFPWLWVFFVALVLAIGKTTQNLPLVYPGGGDEAFWNTAVPPFWIGLPIFMAIVIVFFFSILFLFIPLGQATGEEMAKHFPVSSYLVNILASLLGIWLFSLFSFFNTPPILWFTFGLIGFAIYLALYHKLKWVAGFAFLLTLFVIFIIEPKTIWSPYNRLDITTENLGQGKENLHWGYLLTVQHTFYQKAVNLSDSFINTVRDTNPNLLGDIVEFADGYNLPYKIKPAGSKVLIVGSGMGNDVAAALRAQMGKVNAVEIDPAILQLGKMLHPEKPYDDPRVTAIVDDARSYLNRDKEKYDLVVFGLLDSHSLLSSMSSVRLDSYVYTIESFEQTKTHLANDGLLVVTFAANDWIEERLGRMLTNVFGPGKVAFYRWSGGTTFVAGNNLPPSSVMEKFSIWNSNPEFSNLPLASDNWPYIYLKALRIPAGYWQTLLVIGLLCFALMARSFPEALKPDWHFWLLGAAFLLIEFKSITELALLFGTTWFVNSLAISGVLVMALLANLYVLKMKTVDLRWVYFLLFASLLFGYFFPLARLAGYSNLIKGMIGITILSLPLLFSGIIFSESLRRYGETSRPIAYNFSGSAVGGVLEYASIWWGIKSLYLVAVFLYIGAFLTALKQRLLSK